MSIKVDPSEIENALSKIWDELEPSNKMRACLFNLIFYTKKTERLAYIREIAQKVIVKFPSRILLIVEDTSSLDLLETKVSVLHEPDFACDFIEIVVGDAHSPLIPFLILPHILPDLPVYLIWGEDPTLENPLWDPLKKLADRLIVDSESTSNLPKLARLLIQQYTPYKCSIADLNWARLENWRSLLSRAFYSTERLEELQSAHTLAIVYNAQPTPFFTHTHIQALYMQTWIAAQLGWKLEKIDKSENSYASLYKKGEGTQDHVHVTLTPTFDLHLAPGTLVSLDITTKKECHFSFARKQLSSNHIAMQVSTPFQCAVPVDFIFPRTESGQSLTGEICRSDTSQHYLAVLRSLAHEN